MLLSSAFRQKRQKVRQALFVEDAIYLGKLIAPRRSETIDAGPIQSKRLHIRDVDTGLVYLIDTGSDISLLLADSKTLKKSPSEVVLFAANDSHVHTFGDRAVTLNLNLRRNFKCNFCVAQVPYPIIGADLLAHFHLVPFLHESRLVDTTTGLSSQGFFKSALICGFSLINRNDAFHNILAAFPELTSMPQATIPNSVDVKHHILTSVPPVAERARRLDPKKLAAARTIFHQLVEDGICRPSSSPWCVPIHMIKKKNGDWRVCCDFRRLNAITIPDRYPVPHLHDFSLMLRGKRIFSKLDLHMAYYQILITTEKTCLTLLRFRLHCKSFLPTLAKTIRDRFYGIPIPKLRLIRSKTILPAQHYFVTLLTTLKCALSPTHLVSVWVQRCNSGLTAPGGHWRSFRENFQPRNAFTVLTTES